MDDLTSQPNHSIPEGVDAQTWIGFEERIGQRRFYALIGTVRAAVSTGDFLSAQAALEEARLLRPKDPGLRELELQVVAIAPPARGPRYWSRVGSAVILLAVGVSMIVGLDAFRRMRSLASGGDEFTLPIAVPARLPMRAAIGPLDAPSLDFSEPQPVPVIATAAEADIARPPFRALDDAPALPVLRSRRPDAVIPPRETFEMDRAATDAALDVPSSTVASLPPDPSKDEAPLPSASLPSPPVTPVAAVAAPLVTVTERSRVAEVLRRYAHAYGALDARAARAVWPTVDERALARAFESLLSQQVSLGDCQIDVRGEVANALCEGEAQYVGKVGSGEPRVEPRSWRFELRRDGDGWTIAHAEARRPTS